MKGDSYITLEGRASASGALRTSRRGFMKLAALSGMGVCIKSAPAAGVGAGAQSGKCGLAAAAKESRTLGSASAALKVSALGFGCMGLNYHRTSHPDRRACIKLVHEAIERGITLFDTAESYGYHANELLVGEALKGRPDGFFVSSKFGHKFVNGVRVNSEEDSSPANMRRVCENSLRNLGVEALGIFYQHRFAPPQHPD